jgi:hypothetical protein
MDSPPEIDRTVAYVRNRRRDPFHAHPLVAGIQICLRLLGLAMPYTTFCVWLFNLRGERSYLLPVVGTLSVLWNIWVPQHFMLRRTDFPAEDAWDRWSKAVFAGYGVGLLLLWPLAAPPDR